MKKQPAQSPDELLTEADRQASFERQQKIMAIFTENAKTYIQLSGAALALTLTFAHDILHIPKEQSIVNKWMILMWACFLVTIIAGAFYQYLAVKDLEIQDAEIVGLRGFIPIWGWLAPGLIYGIILGAFYGGTIIFTVYAIIMLRGPM